MRGKTLQDVLLAVIMIIPVGGKRRRQGGGACWLRSEMVRDCASALTHQHDEEEGLDLIRQEERDRLRAVQR